VRTNITKHTTQPFTRLAGSAKLALRRNSRGQIAVIMTLAAIPLLGAMSLGTDIAVLYYNWGLLQKAADSAAAAGANYLPNDTTVAKSTAISFAESNGILASEISTPTFDATGTQITIHIARTVPYNFARILGLTTAAISVNSTASTPYAPKTIGSDRSSATCGGSTGQYDIPPIAVDNKTAAAWVAGQSYSLNQTGTSNNGEGSWVDSPGNWGFIDLCGASNSSSSLRTSIANGFYGPMSIGDSIQNVTGVKNGPDVQGFTDRLGLSTDNPTNFDPTDPRAVIVPLASFAGCNGNCTLTVTGFMSFYIDSYNSGVIQGHFISMVPPSNSIGDPSVTTDAGVKGIPIVSK
jgi:Flp pilus assembly protein TadG